MSEGQGILETSISVINCWPSVSQGKQYFLLHSKCPMAVPGCAADPRQRAAPCVLHYLGLVLLLALEVTDGNVQVFQQ